MLPLHDQNVLTRVPLRSLLTLQLRMVYTHSGFNTTTDLRASEKKIKESYVQTASQILTEIDQYSASFVPLQMCPIIER